MKKKRKIGTTPIKYTPRTKAKSGEGKTDSRNYDKENIEVPGYKEEDGRAICKMVAKFEKHYGIKGDNNIVEFNLKENKDGTFSREDD